MASLTTRNNGTRFIQFAGPDGSRPTIRLGRLPKKEAETILAKVEALAAAALAKTSWDRQTAEWVGRSTPGCMTSWRPSDWSPSGPTPNQQHWPDFSTATLPSGPT